jgi:hypothetical protein
MICKRAGDVFGLADGLLLPRFLRARQVQVADGKAGQSGLGPRAAAGGALVADLATGTGGRAREGADGRGVVVRLHLHQHMRNVLACAIQRRIREALRQPALHAVAFHHSGVVVVGHHGVLR